MSRAWTPSGFCPGRANGELRPEGPRQGGVLGRGLQAPLHQLGGLWERCKLPSGVLGGAPVQMDFLYSFDL